MNNINLIREINYSHYPHSFLKSNNSINFELMMTSGFKISQYACAVLLILSSIALVAYQVVVIADVANGLLIYIGQAFLLAGSIFGLDYYVKLISEKIKKLKD